MLNKFVDVIIRKFVLEKATSINYAFSKFFYPKLAFVTGKNVQVLDVQCNINDDLCKTDCSLETDGNIIDVFLQGHYLWLILESGQLVLYDLLKNLQLRVEYEDSNKYLIKQFKTDGIDLYFVNNNEHYYRVPQQASELFNNYSADKKEVYVVFEKAKVSKSLHCQKFYNILKHEDNVTGLQLEIDRGALIIKCPLTGLRAVAVGGVSMDSMDVIPWCEMAIISKGDGIIIVNLIDGQIQLELNSNNTSFVPIVAWRNDFYYISTNYNEISVHRVHRSSLDKEGLILTDDTSTVSNVQSRNQSCLKEQLQEVINSVLNDSICSTDTLVQIQNIMNEIHDLTYLLAKVIELYRHDYCYRCLLEILQSRSKIDINVLNNIGIIYSKMDIIEYVNLLQYDKYNKHFILDGSLVDICTSFINNGDLDLASMVWVKLRRFYNVTEADISTILNSTPNNIKMNSFILWLKNFIPSILEDNPFFVDIFVKWTTDRIFSFEKSPYWPKIGIKFLEEILLVLQSSQINFITIRPISMDYIDILIVNIKKIYELKEKYKINMLLEEFSSLSSPEVALIMLQRCYTEDLESFLHNYLTAFATEYSLDLDSILRTYVERETLESGGGADEARLRIILNVFYINNTKLQCLLDVVRTLDVPWPPAMHELTIFCVTLHETEFTMCDEGLQLIHDIKMEINFAKLKVVLKKYNFPLTTTDYLLVLHNIVNAPVVDMNDLKTIIQSLSGYANYGNILYINRCLHDCFVKKSLEYFKYLPKIDQKVVIKAIVIKYEFLMNDFLSSPLIERSYLDFIKGTHAIDIVKLSKIEAMYHMKNSYNISTNFNEMSCESQRNCKITEWLKLNAESVSSGRGACVSRLARLPQTFMSTIVELLSQASGNVENHSLIESFVHIFNSNVCVNNIESLISHFRNIQKSETLMNCCQVLIQLIHYCPEEYIHVLVAVLSLFSAIFNTSNIVKHLTIAWKFHYIFVPMSNISSTDNLIKSLINIFAKNSLSEKKIENINVKNDFVPFRILSMYTYRHITFESTPDVDFVENKEIIAKQMVSNISSSSQECDELFLASALLLLNTFKSNTETQKPDCLWKVLEDYGESTPISKYLGAPMMQRALGLNYSLTNALTTAPYNILKTKYNLDLADLALPDITEDTWDAKIVLYYVLKNYPDTSLQRLQSYCHTLNVDIDDGLSLQLISQIVSWELKYIISPDDWQCLQMYYDNNENDLYAKCTIFWNSIKNKSFIIDILRDFWKKGEVSLQGRLVTINPYYYEIYLCIYKLIDKHANWLNINEYFLLHFLKDYKRRSKPKQYEFELFSVKGMFPEIGHYRLPFQLFMREDMWSNLKSEITLATYEHWLPIVSILNLDPDLQIACDMLCSNALKQTMTSRKRNNEVSSSEKHIEPWRLEAKEEQLLRAAHRCVRHIANMEWAAACLFYVLQGCARGADQVAAAQLCYHFAQRWAEVQPANRAVRQMEKLHGTLSTRHALHKIDWACEDLLRFVAEPNQLVRAIYFHPDFVNKMTRYNINKAVDEIADKNNVNVGSIRIQILENILEQNIEDKKEKPYKIGLTNNDLMRAKHILRATCPKMGAMYLARIALEDETDFNKKKKLRALQCLISLVEPDTTLKVTNMERQSLWHGLIDLFFTIRLENVDMPWAIATYAKDKLRTLEQICCASENNTEGLQLAAELSVRYGCEENILNLVPRLIATGLHDVLNTLLCRITSPPNNLIRNAWRTVITSPFIHADYPITDRQRHSCLKVINTLPLCSYLTDEDLSVIWKNCIRIKCYSIACLILPFMSSSAQQSLTELKKVDKRNLIAGLKNLQTESYLINGALTVIENMTSRKIR